MTPRPHSKTLVLRCFRVASGFLFFFGILPGVALAANQSKPNVLIIIADQWRAQAFGFAGDPNVKTPHLDAFEHESIDCCHAISTVPVCSPTRATLLTGRHALTHGVFLNDVPLRPGSVTFAKVLKQAGYDTGYVGKWHLNGDGRSAFIPRDRRPDFDYWKVLECTHDYNNSHYYADTPEKLLWTGYDAIAQTRDIQDYLRRRPAMDRPFLLMLSWGPPHPNYFTAPEKYRALYDPSKLTLRGNVPAPAAAETRRDLAGYYAHCTALDDCLGDLMATLRDTGLEKKTIVIFTSDHGDMLGSHGLNNKQVPYDESIRIPLLYHLPPSFRVKPRRLEAVINSEDFMPTLLGLCGAPIPPAVEGLDYSGYLRGGRHPSDNAALIACPAPFGEWNRAQGGREYRGIRTSRFTYVRDLNGPWLLFDNAVDPLQMTNLVELQSKSAEDLRLEMDGHLRQKLAQAHDEFLPAAAYITRWGYTVDKTGTAPYQP